MGAASNPDPLADILRKLAACIRLMTSNNPGEVDGGMFGIRRLVAGSDAHAIADRIEKSHKTNIDRQKIETAVREAHALGYAEGVKAAESKQHGTGVFRNTDGKLDWREVALYVQREKHRLPVRHHDFIDDMAGYTTMPEFEPSVKRHQYLHGLFLKLGGKIT